MSSRGAHLVHGDRGFTTGGGWIAHLAAPFVASVLERIDARMKSGGIDAILPGGERRRLGFRAPGPCAFVELRSWMALVRLAVSGSVGWYKAWELGEWTSADPVPLFELFSLNALPLGELGRAKGPFRWMNVAAHRLRDNAPRRARENIAAHYDLGNDFYSAWLDETMTYSSARFGFPDEPLESAQLRKIHSLLDRLDLVPGMRLLEIGSGWGTLAIEAAKRGASVVGLTLSEEQRAWADQRAREAGFAGKVKFRLQDYRDVSEKFDAVASVEMVEAVGERWWGAYVDCIARTLKPGGRAALQFISIDHRLFDRYARNADFIQTYIFPGGQLLDDPVFEELARQRGLSCEDRETFGPDYAATLRHWRERYDAAVAIGRLDGFDDRFHRLWRYYLMYCEGGFRGGAIDVAQLTLVKAG